MGDSAVYATPVDALVVKAYEKDSIEEVSSLIKQTIRSVCLSRCLQAIQIARVKKKYEVKCVFENPGRMNLEEFENLIAPQIFGLDDSQATPNKRLYENRAGYIQVEVYAASIGVIPRPVVVKRYYCIDISSVNKCIQEVLLQTRLSSAYTCRLLDFSLRLCERCLLEVELVMEILQGDLEGDL